MIYEEIWGRSNARSSVEDNGPAGSRNWILQPTFKSLIVFAALAQSALAVTASTCTVSTSAPIACTPGYYLYGNYYYQMECANDITGGTYTSSEGYSLRACMGGCSVTPGCTGVTFNSATDTCRLYTGDITVVSGSLQAAPKLLNGNPCVTTTTVAATTTVTEACTTAPATFTIRKRDLYLYQSLHPRIVGLHERDEVTVTVEVTTTDCITSTTSTPTLVAITSVLVSASATPSPSSTFSFSSSSPSSRVEFSSSVAESSSAIQSSSVIQSRSLVASGRPASSSVSASISPVFSSRAVTSSAVSSRSAAASNAVSSASFLSSSNPVPPRSAISPSGTASSSLISSSRPFQPSGVPPSSKPLHSSSAIPSNRVKPSSGAIPSIKSTPSGKSVLPSLAISSGLSSSTIPHLTPISGAETTSTALSQTIAFSSSFSRTSSTEQGSGPQASRTAKFTNGHHGNKPTSNPNEVVIITLTDTFVVPCSTGLRTSTVTMTTTHCGCTETPLPTIPMVTYTTTLPNSWGFTAPVVVKTPASASNTAAPTSSSPGPSATNPMDMAPEPLAPSRPTNLGIEPQVPGISVGGYSGSQSSVTTQQGGSGELTVPNLAGHGSQPQTSSFGSGSGGPGQESWGSSVDTTHYVSQPQTSSSYGEESLGLKTETSHDSQPPTQASGSLSSGPGEESSSVGIDTYSQGSGAEPGVETGESSTSSSKTSSEGSTGSSSNTQPYVQPGGLSETSGPNPGSLPQGLASAPQKSSGSSESQTRTYIPEASAQQNEPSTVTADVIPVVPTMLPPPFHHGGSGSGSDNGYGSNQQGPLPGNKTAASTLIPSASLQPHGSVSPSVSLRGGTTATQMAATPLFTGAASRASKEISGLVAVLGGVWILL
ncbi:hypothetical protein BO71DRAFT_473829 [Aspergillus ellipticus CBS 707.79]|uniref:Apple domain-containing protein n=1 Tax=Aspergillus ellipticus CBS 707.79 TaxID=1448320 RepID=A0A319DW04_9EURO|nr:hypothetical protein BO71DRAFT_473829 [Aspergillus ellipticus CBS 707.79]